MKRSAIALLLSILEPGLGQVYNRELRKALFFLLLPPALICLAATFDILHSFWGIASWVVLGVGVLVATASDAVTVAWRQSKSNVVPPLRRRPLALTLLIAGLLLAAGIGKYDFGLLQVQAFRTPEDSMSMAPTLISGDRFVCDMRAYAKRSPRREDLVLMSRSKAGPTPVRVVKRVIAVEGDQVTILEDGIVLVNGNMLKEPYIMHSTSEGPSPPYRVGTYSIPAGEFFVMGDNRPDSYDSRFPDFGLLDRSQILGKPLYIYYSKKRARIGARLQ